MRVDESLKEKCITSATVTAETDFDHVETTIVDWTPSKEIEKMGLSWAELSQNWFQYRGLMNSIIAELDGNANFSSANRVRR